MMTIQRIAVVMVLASLFPFVSFSDEAASTFLDDDIDLNEMLADVSSNLTIETITSEQLSELPFFTINQAKAVISLRDSLDSVPNLLARLSGDSRFSPIHLMLLSELPSERSIPDIHSATRTGAILVPDEPVGESVRYYSRSNLHYGRDVTAILLIDRDPSEPRAIDLYAGSLTFHAPLPNSSITIGDYRPGFAQGLVFSRYSRFYVSGTDIDRSDAKRIASTSFEETLFLRGVHYRYTDDRLSVSAWGSRRGLDAVFDENDHITTIRESGIHTSDEHRNSLTETMIGIRPVLKPTKRSHAGITLSHAGYSYAFSGASDERSFGSPSGSDLLHLSIDAGIEHDTGELFFEHARLLNHGNATVAGLSLHSGRLSTAVQARRYDIDYYSRHAAPFSTFGASSNEEGIYWAASLTVDSSTSLETRYDIGQTLTRRYYTSMPEKRRRITGIIHHTITPRLKSRITIRDTHDTFDTGYRRSYLLFLEQKPRSSPIETVRTALAWAESDHEGGPYAEASAALRYGPAKFTALVNLYDIPSYTSRLYRYSPDLPGRGATLPFWGRGYGLTLVIRLKCLSVRYIGIDSDQRDTYRRFSAQLDTKL